jgi:hypothetical protein
LLYGADKWIPLVSSRHGKATLSNNQRSPVAYRPAKSKDTKPARSTVTSLSLSLSLARSAPLNSLKLDPARHRVSCQRLLCVRQPNVMPGSLCTEIRSIRIHLNRRRLSAQRVENKNKADQAKRKVKSLVCTECSGRKVLQEVNKASPGTVVDSQRNLVDSKRSVFRLQGESSR